MHYEVEALGGYSLELPDGDHIAKAVAKGKPYEYRLLQMAAELVGNGVVVDVGAHAGNHTVYLAKAGAKVHAFEPNSQILPFLNRNVTGNDLAARVSVYPVGLWGEPSTGQVLQGPPSNSGNASIESVENGPVELVPLDSLALAPDLLKIDVEGAEQDMLRGAIETLKAHRPAVFVEVHEHLDQVLEFLSEFGYRQVGGSWAASPTYLFVARPAHRLRAARFMAPPTTSARIIRLMRSRARKVLWILRSYVGLVRARRAAVEWSQITLRPAVEWAQIMRLRVPVRRPGKPENSAELVVSLTSFPARIGDAWIPIETILRQDQPPGRVVLVLFDDEFPDRKLPRKIRQQQRRGLEILWTPQNMRSFGKLVPTRLVYPDATIITIDDDCMYVPWLVSALTSGAIEHPNALITHRGRVVRPDTNGLAPYTTWPKASSVTPSDCVLLTGVGGTLYPPGVLPMDLLTDIDLALRLCPTADDIWFWAVSRAAGTPTHCLGTKSYAPLRRQNGTPALETLNVEGGENDKQLASVVEYFGFEFP